jgi:hypothetical protein
VDFGKIEAYEIAGAALRWLDAHNGLVTALATVLIGWFTYELYKANKLGIGHTRTIERAYVKMSHTAPGLTYGNINDTGFDVRIAVKNFGKTPARICKVILKAKPLSPGEKVPERPDYANNQFEEYFDAFLVTDDEIFVECNMQLGPRGVVDVEVGNMEIGGKKRLIVFGYVDYTDQFDVRHRSGYGREYKSDPRNNLIYLTQPGYNYDEIVS